MKIFNRRTQLSVAAALCVFASLAQARSDESFMKEAAEAGNAEIQIGNLAQTKAQRADVKSFASTMVSDHTKVADELKQLADSKKVKLPEGPSIAQKAEIKMIDAGDNAKFDERYTKTFGIKAHESTIKLFEEAAQNAKDADVKAWAQKTLPGLQHHLEMAKALAMAGAGTKP